MKRILVGSLLVLAFIYVKAQSVNTQTAYNFLKEYNRAKTQDDKQKKLAEAKKYIDDASVNSETSGDGKTWFYKALIYINLYRDNPGNQEFLNIALSSFKNAYKFDTKKKYTEEIQVNIDTLRQRFYQEGVEKFNQRKYEESMFKIENAANLFQIVNQTDTALLLIAAVAADKAERYDKARDYYLSTLKAGKNTAEVYIGLTNYYTKLREKENAYDIMKKGRDLFPKDEDLIKAETNMYLGFGEDEKALEKLKMITQTDSLNPSVFFVMGTLYDKAYNDTIKTMEERGVIFGNAVKAYEKAIQINPKYFDAYFNLGALYFNTGANYHNAANKLPLEKAEEYKKLSDQGTKNFELALPFLTIANELDPSDMNTLLSLKQIYSIQGKKDKIEEINVKINELRKK